jgi:glycosyltransferase involved in cell wall biosynthesis
VTNDIATDQRINRIASTLSKWPAEVKIIGIFRYGSLSLKDTFGSHRIKMIFRKGPLFYAEYNLRLFGYLLFERADIFVANDLDTLPAVFCAARIRRRPLVYDSHEFFTELPELINRKFVRNIWEYIESMLLPRVKHAYTVSPSIAAAYEQRYGIRMEVIRNLPLRASGKTQLNSLRKKNERLILYQGSLNIGRGLESAIKAMQYVTNVRLIIAGSGYHEKNLRELVRTLKLQEKVNFIGRIRSEKLFEVTIQADLGISLEENMGLNYCYALPNKLFDYIQAEIPVLVSNLPEMANIVNTYRVGKTVDNHDPKTLAGIITEMLENSALREEWKENLIKASDELCWENEEMKLLDIYRNV